MIPAAWTGGLIYVAVGLAVLIATVFVAGLVARLVGEQARKRQMRSDMVVVTRRVAMAFVVLLGIFLALGFAVQNANITLSSNGISGPNSLENPFPNGLVQPTGQASGLLTNVGLGVSFDGHQRPIDRFRPGVTGIWPGDRRW